MNKPLVGILMGSKTDWETMRHVSETLEKFGVPSESRVLSAHRTPRETTEYVGTAASRGLEVLVAGAGGAAHLAGVAAAHTTLPVLGVPVESASLKGLDSLLATVQMPGGIPVATFAIGKPGAVNAALFAVAILAGAPELGKSSRISGPSRPRKSSKRRCPEPFRGSRCSPNSPSPDRLLLGAAAARLRPYATIAVLGFLGRAGALALPPGLHVMTSQW